MYIYTYVYKLDRVIEKTIDEKEKEEAEDDVYWYIAEV